MKLTVILTFLTASLVLTTPFKRGNLAGNENVRMITHTFYTTITEGPSPQPTGANASRVWWGWYDWHKDGNSRPKYGPTWTTSSTRTCISTETTASSTQETSAISDQVTSSSPSSSSDSSTSASSSASSSSSTLPTSESSSSTDVSSPSSSSASSTSTSTSSPSSSSTSDAPSATQLLSEYAQKILEQHNLHRKNHSVSDLTWSDQMVSIAQDIAESCVYAHNMTAAPGISYGQNIGAGYLAEQVPAMITNAMYNDEIEVYPGYGIADPTGTDFHAWAHFSQIVWKATTEVGCATKHCNQVQNTGDNVAPYFTVCNYYPEGNMAPLYADNVLKPGDMDTVWVPM